ncbi:MAG: restriction endonuclease [Sarcina sp.]
MIRKGMIITSFIAFIWLVIQGQGLIGVALFVIVFGLCQQEDRRVPLKGGIRSIDHMEGIAFEHFTVNLFKSLGYQAKVTVAAGDFGADVIAWKGKEKIAIQCKRYSNKVGVEAVYQILGGAKYYDCNKTIVITNNYFTQAAIELSKKTDTTLIDRTQLKKFIKDAKDKKQLEGYSI